MTINCPVCEGEGTPLGAYTPGPVTWFRCRDCGMVYSDGGALYPEEVVKERTTWRTH